MDSFKEELRKCEQDIRNSVVGTPKSIRALERYRTILEVKDWLNKEIELEKNKRPFRRS
jgi:hypothetical protein